MVEYGLGLLAEIPQNNELLNLKWMYSFTVLGIKIDNMLQELHKNFHQIFDKVGKKLDSGSVMD